VHDPIMFNSLEAKNVLGYNHLGMAELLKFYGNIDQL